MDPIWNQARRIAVMYNSDTNINFVCFFYFGLSGGVKVCDGKCLEAISALSTIEEAEAGAAMSRCDPKKQFQPHPYLF